MAPAARAAAAAQRSLPLLLLLVVVGLLLLTKTATATATQDHDTAPLPAADNTTTADNTTDATTTATPGGGANADTVVEPGALMCYRRWVVGPSPSDQTKAVFLLPARLAANASATAAVVCASYAVLGAGGNATTTATTWHYGALPAEFCQYLAQRAAAAVAAGEERLYASVRCCGSDGCNAPDSFADPDTPIGATLTCLSEVAADAVVDAADASANATTTNNTTTDNTTAMTTRFALSLWPRGDDGNGTELFVACSRHESRANESAAWAWHFAPATRITCASLAEAAARMPSLLRHVACCADATASCNSLSDDERAAYAAADAAAAAAANNGNAGSGGGSNDAGGSSGSGGSDGAEDISGGGGGATDDAPTTPITTPSLLSGVMPRDATSFSGAGASSARALVIGSLAAGAVLLLAL